ncbi:mediator complex subunit 13 C-terminal-domain-containing protein [Mucor mucedo]|uniref:mediator complex subunit 13 C-terminal-domain-containing protein n=1 Tax=Mucor mucedo TaxID=29922 RepID=UPI00221F78AF|nr:mediator complex subunit 13 C-terminal-domain-containing protein [Mucor mucedo]KAI7891231.1 mediator complex subunit 13 C-terminal-domain-containing protein [Mucor mucedo]
MAAFHQLISINIPCVWQITPSQDKELISLELHVFWFDDKHTGIIDSSSHLKALKELRIGSFNWDHLTAQSPTTPPQLNKTAVEHATLISPGNDYKLFIKSTRNLIHHELIKRGAFALGEFFVFPDTYLDETDIIDTLADQDNESNAKNTMLACMYNIYLTSSNLVFQPNTRRMRIRPLVSEDVYIKNKKVLLCPTGEHASLTSFQSLPTQELQQKMLEQWAEFYRLNPSQLHSTQTHLPSLVTIRTSSGDIITYPTMLIFVPTDTKLSPSAISGLNGTMGLNRGLTEDLGAKASRSTYHQSLKSMHSSIDYWSYRDPILFASNAVISALSMADTSYQHDQLLLHRALIEPVLSSPIMNSKSVIPINTTPLLGCKIFGDYSQQTPPKSSLSSNMNLTEFATSRFQTENPEDLLDGLNPLNDPNIAIVDKNLNKPHLSTMSDNNLTIDPIALPGGNPTTEPTLSAPTDDLNLYNLDAVWNDTNEDFGELDLDVTEADFDFFETPAPVVTPDNVLHILPMDVEPAVTDHTVASPDNILKPRDLTPNNDSLFTPFVASNTNSEDASMEDSIVEPMEAMDYLQTKTQNPPVQKVTPEHPTIVPQNFLPVPINTRDIDAKYVPGGKFMYDPSKERTKRELYSPDYVPTVKKKATKDSPEKPECSLQDVEMTDARNSNCSSSSSDSNSDTSGESSSCTDNDSDTDSISLDQIVDKRLRSFKKFQRSVIYSLLRATPAPLPMDRFQNMDYDSPFTPILADSIKPIKWRQSKAMEKSMDYLCKQAIFGGYPFSSGLAEVSANGGEIEAETAKVLVARRTNIMQMTQEDMVHHPMSYLNSPLLGSIDIKGPLTIQQYYSLYTPNQSHSKYGKYQVKKKRPSQPNLDTLNKPNVVITRNEDALEGSSKMIPFWEKLGLEPYSTKKQINYLVVYPNNRDIETTVGKFFRNLSTVYDTCRLGKHSGDHSGPYRYGLVPVLDNATNGAKNILKNYEDTCENLGRYLANKNDTKLVYHVIYMVNPGLHISSYLDMCRCFYKLKESYMQISGKNDDSKIVLQLMPIDHVLRPSAFGGYQMLGLKDIAFSIYAKCPSIVSNKRNPNLTAEIYAPAFVLKKPIPRSIDFKLNDIRAFPVLLEKEAKLHMAYCFSYNRAWMSIVWTDGSGELLEYALFPRKSAYKEAWERTLDIAKRTAFPWTVQITKVGLMFNEELLHWLKFISNTDYGVNIVALDLESELNLHFNMGFPDTPFHVERNQQAPTLLDSFGKSHTIGGYPPQEKNATQARNTDKVDEAQILLLNHRISYSQKRERAYKGILRTEAVTEKENWMTPLATGYMIHHALPNKNVNPCMEQFNNEPFVAEVHLIYNHTQHSAYNTLQEIIKHFYALSFVDPIPSSHSCIPFYVVLVERLSRLLLIIDESCK